MGREFFGSAETEQVVFRADEQPAKGDRGCGMAEFVERETMKHVEAVGGFQND